MRASRRIILAAIIIGTAGSAAAEDKRDIAGVRIGMTIDQVRQVPQCLSPIVASKSYVVCRADDKSELGVGFSRLGKVYSLVMKQNLAMNFADFAKSVKSAYGVSQRVICHDQDVFEPWAKECWKHGSGLIVFVARGMPTCELYTDRAWRSAGSTNYCFGLKDLHLLASEREGAKSPKF